MPPTVNKREDCNSCYQFGIVSTKLSDLSKGLSLFFVLLSAILGWGGVELYKMNGTISEIAHIQDAIKKIDNKLDTHIKGGPVGDEYYRTAQQRRFSSSGRGLEGVLQDF